VTITLNGETRDLDMSVDLAQLVDDLSLPSKRIAVELNGLVILRSDWAETRVGDGDKIEVVHFVGGG
jgi:sulfur carrier protein